MRVLCGQARTPLEWGCSKCERDDTSPLKSMAEEERRRLRNCDGITNDAQTIDGHSDPLDENGKPTINLCPWSQCGPADFVAVERWRRWKTIGVFPFAGAGADQPSYVIDELEICEEVSAEIRREMEPKPPKPKKEPRGR